MNVYCWIAMSAGLSAIWLWINKRFVGGFFSPFNLLLPFWVLPVFMCALRLSAHEPEWTPMATMMVSYYTVMLAVVSLAIPLLVPEKPNRKSSVRYQRSMDDIRSRPFTFCLVAVFAVALTAAFYNEIVANPNGVALLKFTADPDASRDASWHTKGSGAMWLLSVPVSTLGPLVYLRALLSQWWAGRMLFFVLAACYPIIALFKMSRADMFTYCFGCVLVHYWWRREQLKSATGKAGSLVMMSFRQRLTLFAAVATLLVISSTIFQQIRSGTGSKGVTKFANQTGIEVELPPPGDALVSELYMYFAIPYHNFARFVDIYPHQMNPGVGLVRPLFSLTLQGEDVQKRLQNIDLDSYLVMLVNTWPIITWNYAEFGYAEVLIAPVIYAALTSIVYVWLRVRPGVVPLIFYYVVVAYQWVWMFSNNNFTGVQFLAYSLFALPFMGLYYLVRHSMSSSSARHISLMPSSEAQANL